MLKITIFYYLQKSILKLEFLFHLLYDDNIFGTSNDHHLKQLKFENVCTFFWISVHYVKPKI